MTSMDAVVGELRQQLLDSPADRRPVAHATARFHLGSVLLGAGRCDEAIQMLTVAAEMFAEHERVVDAAKAVNLVGVARRDVGQVDEAVDAFQAASRAFAEYGLRLESGAALYNLGLAERDRGDLDAALTSLVEACDLLDGAGVRDQAGAAFRELGTLLLARGELDAAGDVLERAVSLAAESGDHAALGAASNALGLVRLSCSRPDEAAALFADSSGAHPRSVRPQDYAMAKANLALAEEQRGHGPHARLAARQALGVALAHEPVREQAAGVLARLGDPAGDLPAVLDEESDDRWLELVREEMRRWLDTDRRARVRELGAWLDAQLAHRDGAGLAEVWLAAVLELPATDMEVLIRDLLVQLDAWEPAGRERLRTDMSRAMVRFQVPQWMRLLDTFNRVASEQESDMRWS